MSAFSLLNAGKKQKKYIIFSKKAIIYIIGFGIENNLKN
jgi:hypothetical protein